MEATKENRNQNAGPNNAPADVAALTSNHSTTKCARRSKVALASYALKTTHDDSGDGDGDEEEEKDGFFSTWIQPENGTIVVRSVLPHGICIDDETRPKADFVGGGGGGKRIVATEPFRAGETLYRGYAALVETATTTTSTPRRTVGTQQALGGSDPVDDVDDDTDVDDDNDDSCYTLRVHSAAGDFVAEYQCSATHSVEDYYSSCSITTTTNPSRRCRRRVRQVYGFDAFMNHSCDANTYHPAAYRTETELCYDAVALRDISRGEELTCDYACFDYICDGHRIETCRCGASNCRGKMLGFANLTLSQKVDILHLCEPEIARAFWASEEARSIELLRSNVPEGIVLRDCGRQGETGGRGHSLVASRGFEIGDNLFTNRARIVALEDTVSKRFIVQCCGNGEDKNDAQRYILLDNCRHLLYRQQYAENLGFDSFMDHSCAPNTTQSYRDREEYSVYASRTIRAGDKITCDYTDLGNDAVGAPAVPKTKFVCRCGATDCRGLLSC